MEIKKNTLPERIKDIRLILQRPYHIFAYLEGGDIMLVLENDEGNRLSFRGKNIIDSIVVAEAYVKHEQEMGTLRPKEEQPKEKEEPVKEEIEKPTDEEKK